VDHRQDVLLGVINMTDLRPYLFLIVNEQQLQQRVAISLFRAIQYVFVVDNGSVLNCDRELMGFNL
jgi:hypothetical protein